MATDGPQRAQLVSALWNLKQAVKKHPLPGIPYIHFNTLLRQPAYRREILEAAKASEDETVRRLAQEAESMDTGNATLLDPDDKRWLEQRDREIASAYTAALAQASRSKRRYAFIAGGTLAVVVIAAVAWFAWDRLSGAHVVSGSIEGEVRWTAERGAYVLDGIVVVTSGSRLMIEPGVRVRGRPGSALVVARGGFLHAKGTPAQPIVLTSAQEPGLRNPGDWGGLVLLGSAPTNAGSAIIEGFPAGDSRGAYGGNDPAHACGVLEYVRIEFAGFEAFANNELNGLTLGGCGSGTVVSHVQVHRALDDGVELFGGTVDLSHVLVTQAGDDALDWDQGWAGRLQFFISQQTEIGDNAFEGDSNTSNPEALPRSRPVIYNATLIGGDRGAQRAMTLRTGTGGAFANLIASGFALEFADFRGSETPALIDSGELEFATIVLHDIGDNQRSSGFTAETSDADDDGDFSESEFFLRQLDTVYLGSSLRIPVASRSERAPGFVPTGQFDGQAASPPKGEFWDEAATYPGAVAPGESQPWYDGWTAFPTE
jgi:hypothetical protein